MPVYSLPPGKSSSLAHGYGPVARRERSEWIAAPAYHGAIAPNCGSYFLVACALTSYDVLVASKKFTNWRVSFAVAIHLAGFDTL